MLHLAPLHHRFSDSDAAAAADDAEAVPAACPPSPSSSPAWPCLAVVAAPVSGPAGGLLVVWRSPVSRRVRISLCRATPAASPQPLRTQPSLALTRASRVADGLFEAQLRPPAAAAFAVAGRHVFVAPESEPEGGGSDAANAPASLLAYDLAAAETLLALAPTVPPSRAQSSSPALPRPLPRLPPLVLEPSGASPTLLASAPAAVAAGAGAASVWVLGDGEASSLWATAAARGAAAGEVQRWQLGGSAQRGAACALLLARPAWPAPAPCGLFDDAAAAAASDAELAAAAAAGAGSRSGDGGGGVRQAHAQLVEVLLTGGAAPLVASSVVPASAAAGGRGRRGQGRGRGDGVTVADGDVGGNDDGGGGSGDDYSDDDSLAAHVSAAISLISGLAPISALARWFSAPLPPAAVAAAPPPPRPRPRPLLRPMRPLDRHCESGEEGAALIVGEGAGGGLEAASGGALGGGGAGASQIAADPTGRLLAVATRNGRVLVLQAHDLAVLRLWKGVRGAQLAFLAAAAGGDRPVRLLIYSPARGSLEAWPLRVGARVAAFRVAKGGWLCAGGAGAAAGRCFFAAPAEGGAEGCQAADVELHEVVLEEY